MRSMRVPVVGGGGAGVRGVATGSLIGRSYR
ncbi:MAG: hypothetical protein QOG79_3159 [Mycobacterium sp.]|jgi:hypothetical protein|nr:hypothetical protein [Mycobacterium sp.]